MKYKYMVGNRDLNMYIQDHKLTKTVMEVKEMASIKEEAEAYEPTTTKTVADMEVFDVGMETETHKGVNKEGEEYSYKYVTDKDGVRYRIPWVVLGEIKEHLKENEKLTLFRVKKSGEGKLTKYMVIPVVKS